MSHAAYWDRIARKYATQPISNLEAYEYTLGRTRSYLKPTDRILELGCGTASTALLLAPSVAHVTATDISAEMVEIGREKAAKEGVDNITNLKAGVGDPALGNNYDAVLALNLFHLTDNPSEAIMQCREMVKPGGLFISKTPCLEGAWGLLRVPGFFMYHLGRWPRVRFFSVRKLERMITEAGFEIVESGNYPRTPPSRYVVARRKA